MFNMFNGKYIVGEWVVDATTNTICRNNGREISLPPRLIDMLTYFAQHPKEVISREELVNALWNRTAVTDQAVTQTVFELRKSLRDGRAVQSVPEYIQTVPKRGYRLLAAVEVLSDSDAHEQSAVKEEKSVTPIQDSANYEAARRSTEEGGSKLVNLVKTLWLDTDILGFKKTPY